MSEMFKQNKMVLIAVLAVLVLISVIGVISLQTLQTLSGDTLTFKVVDEYDNSLERMKTYTSGAGGTIVRYTDSNGISKHHPMYEDYYSWSVSDEEGRYEPESGTIYFGGSKTLNVTLRLVAVPPNYSNVTITIVGQGTADPPAGNHSDTWVVGGTLYVTAYPASGWRYELMRRNGVEHTRDNPGEFNNLGETELIEVVFVEEEALPVDILGRLQQIWQNFIDWISNLFR